MNYGYSESGKMVPLDHEDEQNRYSLQLYHHLAEMVDLNDKDVVDVGSGRGGGLSYIARKWKPSSMAGIDLTKDSVAFSNKQHNHKNLQFFQGDALNLPLKNSSCDVLINVESSHRYHSMEGFFNEVKRTLRPGGYFLFTDFRYDYEWSGLTNLLQNLGLEIVDEKDITSNVVESLDLDSDRRNSLVKKYAPRILHKDIMNFAGSTGTETYNYFVARKFTYKSFKIRKPEINLN